MRRWLTLTLCALLLTGCGQPDWNEPQKGEADLEQVFRATGDPYPLTQPFFIRCGFYRLKGQSGYIPRTRIHDFMKEPDDVDGALALRELEKSC